jgi:hypothetical protein
MKGDDEWVGPDNYYHMHMCVCVCVCVCACVCERTAIYFRKAQASEKMTTERSTELC